MFDSNSCIICNDSISDPVCKNCYIKQIKILLNDLKMHPMAKEIILGKVKNKFPIETLNDIDCILCKQENVDLCYYCFSINLNNILRGLNLTEELIRDFGFNPMHETYLESKINIG